MQYALLAEARELLPDERTAGCKRRRINKEAAVDAVYSSTYKAAYYGNLQSCGSVWICPLCAARVSEWRRLELDEAVNRWWADGHGVLLFTFTLQHAAGESWKDVLAALTKAHHRFWSDRAGQSLQASIGYRGRVRALEPTYGKNGPHPHFHVLVFADRELSVMQFGEIEGAAVAQWTHVLSRMERYASDDHGLEVQPGRKRVANYVAKFGNEWSIAHELTKGRKKKGGDTPLDLLAKALYGDEKAGRVWQQYAGAFKGKRQLVWSDGLRQLLGLGQEQADCDLAGQVQDSLDDVLASLARSQWRAILGNDIRAELLNVADTGDWRKVRTFLEDFGIFGVQYPVEADHAEEITLTGAY